MDGSRNCRSGCSARSATGCGRPPFERLALGVAAWMRYVTGIDEAARANRCARPDGGAVASDRGHGGAVAERLAPALLTVEPIFGRDLPIDPRFVSAVTESLKRLFAVGANRTLAELESLV